MLKLLLVLLVGFYYLVNADDTAVDVETVDGDIEDSLVSTETSSEKDGPLLIQQDVPSILAQQDNSAACRRISCRPCYGCRDGICLYNPSLPGCSRGTRGDACDSVTCGQCESCQVNSRNEPRCIQDHTAGCCPRNQVERRCADPCRDWQRQRLCPRADMCRANYCGQCTAQFYDAELYEVAGCSSGTAGVDSCRGVDCGTCRVCVPTSTSYTCQEDRQCTSRDVCNRVRCSAGSVCQVQGSRGVCVPDNSGIGGAINDTYRWCRAPAEPGQCPMNLIRWYYDRFEGKCKTFTYTGCKPNENNFVRKQDCDKACRDVPACPPVTQPRAPPTGCRYIEELGHDMCPTMKLVCNEKSGDCPATNRLLRGTCVNRCNDDNDCTGDMKCCSNGCGRECSVPTNTNNGLDRAGTCPASSRLTTDCISECSRDTDCARSQKCCNNGCGNSCTVPENSGSAGVCPNSNDLRRDCSSQCRADRECSPDERCCYNGCGRTCVRVDSVARERPGTCPSSSLLPRGCRSECVTDDDCSDRLHKCCSNGCGTTCTRADEPTPRPGSCPLTTTLFRDCRRECEYDLDCPNRDHKCCTNGCGTTCTASDRSSVTGGNRPGTCPSNLSLVRNCRRACEHDRDCFNRDDKCCNNGCGTTCTTPRNSGGGGTISHSGRCPAESSLVKNCRTECVRDDECGRTQKCCYNGCGRSCTNPQGRGTPSTVTRPTNGGVCPAAQDLVQECNTECRRDSDCRGSSTERCCYNGCGYSCAETANAPVLVERDCPAPGTAGLFRDCRTRCGTDTDCLTGEKCCYNGCSYSCAAGIASKDVPALPQPVRLTPAVSNGQCKSNPCKSCETCTEESNTYKCTSACAECEVCSSGGTCISRELKCIGSFDPCQVITCPAYPQARCNKDRCNCNLATYSLPDGTVLSTPECKIP